MKLIDKSALVAEIEKRIKETESMLPKFDQFWVGQISAFKGVLKIINTLEVKEVCVDLGDPKGDIGVKAVWDSSKPLKISRHGDSHIEAMKEALRMEYEKGRADVLRCIDPDVMVADFCSQPFSKTRSLASIYRQGIIDIIKRINRNEETSINSTHSIDDGGVQLPKP